MPPKKPAASKPVTKSSTSSSKPGTTTAKASPARKPLSKSSQQPKAKVPTSTKVSPKKNVSKSNSKDGKMEDQKKKVKVISKEELAAIKLQSHFRRLLVKHKVQKRKNEKQDYEELIEKLQREAWLEIVKREREEAEKERLREEEERKLKREEAKRKKLLLEAAFDGDKDTIENILNQAKKSDMGNTKLTGPALKLHLIRHQNALIQCEDANNNSLLSEAAAGGNGDCINYLINKGANVNSRGAYNRTPLYRAAFGGHVQAVQILLENGADPRLYADDGNKPEQIAAIAEIADILVNWNIEETEKLLARIKSREEQRLQTEKEQAEFQTKIITDEIKEAEKAYKTTQKQLRKAYEELNKRIFEHDKCLDSGQVKSDITLQAVHDAEEELLKAKAEEEKAIGKLSDLRLRLREETSGNKDIIDSVAEKGVKCNIKELDDVLLRDVGNRIKNDGRWPLIVDASGQSSVFLRYRDTNYLNALNIKEMEPDVIRKALLGAIRYGKFLVVDMMEVDMLDTIENRIEEIQKGLFKLLLSKEVLLEERYISLAKKSDGEEYTKEKFNSSRIENFKFVLLTKVWNPPDNWLEMFYPIRVIIS